MPTSEHDDAHPPGSPARPPVLGSDAVDSLRDDALEDPDPHDARATDTDTDTDTETDAGIDGAP